MQTLTRLLALAAVSVTAAVSSHASTYANIDVDGNSADWASIPSLTFSFINDTEAGFGIANIKMANNATDLFVLLTLVTPVNSNNPDGLGEGPTLYFGIDRDQTVGTGLNIWDLDQVGTEGVWRNDTGLDTLFWGSLSQGASISPYYTVTDTIEISVSLSTMLGDNSLLFANESFNFVFYTTGNAALGGWDQFAVGGYTLASVPEPASAAALAGLGILGLVALRRRR